MRLKLREDQPKMVNPGIRQWTEPQFFKPILPPFQQLSIPRAFLKHLVDELCEDGIGEATLRNHRSAWKSWIVKVKGFCFTKGWDDFVRDNDLSFGDFLVFTYKGSMVFDVKIFNRSCCEKENHLSPPTPVKKETHKQQEREIKITKPPSKRFRTRRKRSKVAQDSFEIFLTEYNMKRSHVGIPKKFVRAHGLIGKIFQAFFRDEKGISWSVRLTQDSGSGRVRFGGGWLEFLSGNRLKEGDSCVFKLINSGKMSEYVESVRGVKNAIELYVTISISTSSSSSSSSSSPSSSTYDDEDDDDDDADDEWAPVVNSKNNDQIRIRPYNPFFVITLREYNIKESRLIVPRHFARWNGLIGKSFITTLRDGRGRSWRVKLKDANYKKSLYLYGDWAEISSLNGLKEGDTCKFELIRRGKLQVMGFRML